MLKKITRVEIKNYQSHKHTMLDMDSPVVVLSGESDNGKTVIIRALQWVATNRPMGDGFVSHWEMHQTKSGKVALNSDTECSVTVTATDQNDKEHLIKRVKTASENYYVVDGTKLSAIGSGVPKEVTSLLCLNDENIQDQDEKYYLLTLTGSQVSSKLNELVNLDSIDDAYAIIKRQKLDEGASHKEYEAQYYEHKVAVDSLKHIPELVETLDEVKEMNASMEAYAKDVDNINDIISNHRRVDDALADLSMVSSCGRAIERAEGLIKEYDEQDREITHMEAIIDVGERQERLLALLPDVSEKAVDRLVALTENYDRDMDTYVDVSQSVKYWSSLNDKIRPLPEEQFDEWSALDAEYEKAQAEVRSISESIVKFHDVEEALKDVDREIAECESELPDICPLCGQPMEGHAHV